MCLRWLEMNGLVFLITCLVVGTLNMPRLCFFAGFSRSAFCFVPRDSRLFLGFYQFCLFLDFVKCAYKGLLVSHFLDKNARFLMMISFCLNDLVLMKNY